MLSPLFSCVSSVSLFSLTGRVVVVAMAALPAHLSALCRAFFRTGFLVYVLPCSDVSTARKQALAAAAATGRSAGPAVQPLPEAPAAGTPFSCSCFFFFRGLRLGPASLPLCSDSSLCSSTVVKVELCFKPLESETPRRPCHCHAGGPFRAVTTGKSLEGAILFAHCFFALVGLLNKRCRTRRRIRSSAPPRQTRSAGSRATWTRRSCRSSSRWCGEVRRREQRGCGLRPSKSSTTPRDSGRRLSSENF